MSTTAFLLLASVEVGGVGRSADLLCRLSTCVRAGRGISRRVGGGGEISRRRGNAILGKKYNARKNTPALSGCCIANNEWPRKAALYTIGPQCSAVPFGCGEAFFASIFPLAPGHDTQFPPNPPPPSLNPYKAPDWTSLGVIHQAAPAALPGCSVAVFLQSCRPRSTFLSQRTLTNVDVDSSTASYINLKISFPSVKKTVWENLKVKIAFNSFVM